MTMQTQEQMRELDAEMHRICGWIYDASRESWQRQGYWTSAPNNYTTDPAAAMEVLRKLGETHEVLLTKAKVKVGQHQPWLAALVEPKLGGDREVKIAMYADTAEVAICLLAQAIARELFSK